MKQALVSIGFRAPSANEGALYLGALRKTIALNPTIFGPLTFPVVLEAEASSDLGFTGSARHTAFRDKVAAQPGWTAALAQKLVSETGKFKAPRGGSTHHSGVVVDISFPYALSTTVVLNHDTKRERNADALRSAAGVWLNANASSFGFDSYNTDVEIWHQEWRRWRGTPHFSIWLPPMMQSRAVETASTARLIRPESPQGPTVLQSTARSSTCPRRVISGRKPNRDDEWSKTRTT
jgi:hypothetical protein